MAQSYFLDLRARVADFVAADQSCWAAARHFRVSDSFAIKLMQHQRRSGAPAPALGRGQAGAVRDVSDPSGREPAGHHKAGSRRKAGEEHDVSAAPATLSSFLC